MLDTDFSRYCSVGALKNLDGLIQEDEDFDPKAYFTTAYSSGKNEGNQYALPFEAVPTLLFANPYVYDSIRYYRYLQGVSVLKDVTMSEEAAAIIQEDMDDGERVIDNILLGNVIEEGIVEPKFPKYDQVINLSNNEIQQLFEDNKDVESTMKILNRNINAFLKQ